MKKTVLLAHALLLVVANIWAQNIPTKEELVTFYGFQQSEIIVDGERIVYYTYQKGERPTKMLVYLHGSDPSPLFSYQISNGEVNKYCFLKGEFTQLSEDYLYVAIEKIGFEGLIDESNIPKPEVYQRKNSLGNRVFRADQVIDYLVSQNNFQKVIVYGHSEGAPVAAKLATVNTKITHLGFWAGNVLPDFFDFALEARREYYKGNLSAKQAQKQIDEVISGFTDNIAKDTANTDDLGYTNLRWWSYAEPPLNHLLKVDIPIFVQVGTEDVNAPIESSYLLPLEFARLGKTNLSYNVCVGCDHSFKIMRKKGKVESRWNEIFLDFLKWTEETP